MSEAETTKFIYNKLSKEEKRIFYDKVKWCIKDESIILKFLLWLIWGLIPITTKLAKYSTKSWCDENGFFCDEPLKDRKCEHFIGKDKVKKGWESYNNRKVIENL